jgi:DNA-binding CsgD family transcriptional regulator
MSSTSALSAARTERLVLRGLVAPQRLQSSPALRLYQMNKNAGGPSHVNDPTAILSEGQKICLRLVARGMSSKEIAKETGLTPQTVDTYVKASLAKLGASNRREAARILTAWEENGGTVPDDASALGHAARPLESSGWRGLINLPPLGGGYTDHSWTQKTYQVLQVAVIAAATVVALALIIAGLLDTFR